MPRGFGAEPRLHKRGRPHGSGLGQRRWPVERSRAWLLENKRLALRYDRLGFVIQSLLQAACLFLVAGRLAREIVTTASMQDRPPRARAPRAAVRSGGPSNRRARSSSSSTTAALAPTAAAGRTRPSGERLSLPA
jgi:hypothetical protein